MKLRDLLSHLKGLTRRPPPDRSVGRRVSTARHEDTPVPRRSLHLGVDYGTARSKLIFRDYQAIGGDRSYVVRVGDSHGAEDYRIPSTITLAVQLPP